MTMTKERLIEEYGCIDCDATEECEKKYKKVHDNFRAALKNRYAELGIPYEMEDKDGK